MWNTNKLVGNSDQIFQIIFQTWTSCSKFPYSYTWVALWQIPTRLWQDWQTSERGQDPEPWTRGRVTASHPTSALATRRRCRPSTCPRWSSCCSARWRPASCPTPGRQSPATGNNHCYCFTSGNRSLSLLYCLLRKTVSRFMPYLYCNVTSVPIIQVPLLWFRRPRVSSLRLRPRRPLQLLGVRDHGGLLLTFSLAD